MNKQTLKIEGMSCEHCQLSVERALKSVPGVGMVSVDLTNGLAEVSGDDLDTSVLENAVAELGFRIVR